MAFEARVVPFQLTAGPSPTTIDITSSGFGTPTAALFVLSGSTSDSTTEEADVLISVGMTDGTTERTSQMYAKDAFGTTATARVLLTAGVISESSSLVTQGRMGFNSWITDGVKLDYDVEFDQDYRGYAILMKGADDVEVFQGVLDAASKDFALSGAFKPDFCFFSSAQKATNGGEATAINSWGCACRGSGDSITQWSVLSVNFDNKAFVAMAQSITNSKVIEAGSATGVDRSAAFDEWRSDGFGLTRSGTASDIDFHVLAIKLPAGQEALCGNDTALTSTGNKSVTTNYSSGADDSEIAMIIHCVDATAPDTFDIGDDADSISIGAADSAGNQAVCAFKDDDGNTTSQSKSAFLDSAVVLTYDGAGAIEQQADMTNMLDPDLDINYSVVGASADNFFWWAIQVGLQSRAEHLPLLGVA